MSVIGNPYERFKQKMANIEVIEAFLRYLSNEGFQLLTPQRDYVKPDSQRVYDRILEHYGIDPKLLDLEIDLRVKEQERRQRQREASARSRARKLAKEQPTRPTAVAE